MDRRLRIVVADDELDTREYLQEYLSSLGHEVQAAEDGRRLVEVCQEFVPDLIVTDYAMPGLDGWSAVQEVNRHRPVPVILFSGRHDVEPMAQIEGSPVVQVLTKPIKQAELKGAVESVKAEVEGSRSGRSGR
jgi:CheY-like chemotaxis protein